MKTIHDETHSEIIVDKAFTTGGNVTTFVMITDPIIHQSASVYLTRETTIELINNLINTL